jgi:Nbl1 / Borealin N terminal
MHHLMVKICISSFISRRSVEHRTRQLESWLADALENFRIHHEGHPSRIPRIVLSVKMRDLEEKYQGDVQVCLRAMQMDKLVEATATTGVERSTKKRKWLAALDADGQEAESSRGVKNGEHLPECLLIILIVDFYLVCSSEGRSCNSKEDTRRENTSTWITTKNSPKIACKRESLELA